MLVVFGRFSLAFGFWWWFSKRGGREAQEDHQKTQRDKGQVLAWGYRIVTIGGCPGWWFRRAIVLVGSSLDQMVPHVWELSPTSC